MKERTPRNTPAETVNPAIEAIKLVGGLGTIGFGIENSNLLLIAGGGAALVSAAYNLARGFRTELQRTRKNNPKE